jgi:HD superfamily phosphodiesterase
MRTGRSSTGCSKPTLLPAGALAQKVFEMVKVESPEYLHNHCVRTYLFAEAIGKRKGLRYDSELLFIGCMMHDLGIVKKFHGQTRFEVDGADAAVKFLKLNGADTKVTDVIWDAVALHATPHIPLRKQPEIALVHIGAGVDILGKGLNEIAPEMIQKILEEYPRKNLKQSVLEDLISYLKDNPAGGAGYWMSQLAEKYVEGVLHFDFEKAVLAAPFAE